MTLPSLLALLETGHHPAAKIADLHQLRDKAVTAVDAAMAGNFGNAADRCCRWVEDIDMALDVMGDINAL